MESVPAHKLLDKPSFLEYNDGSFVIIDSIKRLPDTTVNMEQGMLLLVICTQGHLRGDVCGRTYDIHAGDSLVGSTKLSAENLLVSPDFDAKILGMTSRALRFNFPCQGKELFDIIVYARRHPVYHLSAAENRLVLLYYDLICEKLNAVDDRYHREIMQSLFCTVLYEIINMILRRADTSSPRNNPLHHSDFIFRRFLELLEQNGHQERSVSAYADWLNISPKHLSSIVRAVSGHSTLHLIHHNVAERIAHKLLSTDMSIKEIAYSLNFSNLSYFGKFCKAQLGCSPNAFRRNGGNPTAPTEEEQEEA